MRVQNCCFANITLYNVFTHVTSIYANLLKQKKEFNSHRTCSKHQYGRRDVVWKRSIAFFAVFVAVAEDAAFVTPSYSTVPRGQTPYTRRLRRKG